MEAAARRSRKELECIMKYFDATRTKKGSKTSLKILSKAAAFYSHPVTRFRMIVHQNIIGSLKRILLALSRGNE
jgi:hypothetical protein